MRSLSRLTIAGGALLLPVFLLSLTDPFPSSGANLSQAKKAKYVGAKLCKNCHNSKENGEAYDKWAAGPHATAFKTLATDKAKEYAKERGIDDPQKSDKCLKCHVTAHGVAKKLAKKIKAKDGVQCESCHGPGDQHMKKRMMAAASGDVDPAKRQTISDGEIITQPDASRCLVCHNEESPGYKPFCFKERSALIRHIDPRKQRSEADMKKLTESCYSECPKCSKEGEKEKKDK